MSNINNINTNNSNSNAILEIVNLEKRFGENNVLRCINLLEEPSGGDILFHG